MLRFMRIVHPKSTRAVSYPVLVPFTERISDYCICFDLSSAVHVLWGYAPFRRTSQPPLQTNPTAMCQSRTISREKAALRPNPKDI